ncbi:adenosylmethionine decarboxylase [Amycolatopsis antarctica]|uniref:S-adenosylmethionine decarboxylase proenzyme n=1 Tax=Amycolatopsis antarctica TaxID=1854586 RepID=A0A263D970_9PSEU|nr:adenosylmethionine decarboxylase [Amycolatopsis antarctica]OZM74558.1 adenosylmethionine decarboxylase [Amycolatopsis antarctica]
MTAEPAPVGTFAGRHVLAELSGVAPEKLNDIPFLRDALTQALVAADATVCQVIAHRFQPQGATVLALLAESHASIHTYPEIGAAFVDVFTCGVRADPEVAVHLLAEALGAMADSVSVVDRGREPAHHRR